MPTKRSQRRSIDTILERISLERMLLIMTSVVYHNSRAACSLFLHYLFTTPFRDFPTPCPDAHLSHAASRFCRGRYTPGQQPTSCARRPFSKSSFSSLRPNRTVIRADEAHYTIFSLPSASGHCEKTSVHQDDKLTSTTSNQLCDDDAQNSTNDGPRKLVRKAVD
jgi:hypothetical protein